MTYVKQEERTMVMLPRHWTQRGQQTHKLLKRSGLEVPGEQLSPAPSDSTTPPTSLCIMPRKMVLPQMAEETGCKKKKKKSGFLWFLSPPYLGFCFDKEKSSSDPIFVKDRRDGTGSRSLSCCWFHCPLRMDKEEDTRDSVMGDHGPIETILVSKKEG